MRAKLTPQEANLLRIRISLSREIKIFTLEDLARNWSISSATLIRYYSDHYRTLSRDSSRKQTLLYKAIDKTKCQICFTPLLGHWRCCSCTMLYHGEKECRCIDKLCRTIIKA